MRKESLVGLSYSEFDASYSVGQVSPPGFEPAPTTQEGVRYPISHSATQPPRLNSAVSSMSLIS